MALLPPRSGNGKNARQRRSLSVVSFGKNIILGTVRMDETVVQAHVDETVGCGKKKKF